MKGRQKQLKSSHERYAEEQTVELASLLSLAIAQLNSSIAEGSDSVEQLTHSFTNMVTELDRLFEQLEQEDINHHSIIQTGDTLRASINSAVIAFQFYDRLTQRIVHVSDSLCQLNHLLPDQKPANHLDKWNTLKTNIRASYTMEAERQMFDHIMAGYSVDDGIKLYEQVRQATNEVKAIDDDIEFF